MTHRQIIQGIITTTVIALLSGCVTLAPREDRQIEFTEKTELNQRVAFDRALSWIENHIGSPEIDSEKGDIALKSKTLCNYLKPVQDPNDYTLQFILFVRANDNKMIFQFEDLKIIDKYGNTVNREQPQVTSVEKVNLVRPCVAKIKDQILQHVKR